MIIKSIILIISYIKYFMKFFFCKINNIIFILLKSRKIVE